MPMSLSDQGVMVTCRSCGPCTVEIESSHAMAARETPYIVFTIFPLEITSPVDNEIAVFSCLFCRPFLSTGLFLCLHILLYSIPETYSYSFHHLSLFDFNHSVSTAALSTLFCASSLGGPPCPPMQVPLTASILQDGYKASEGLSSKHLHRITFPLSQHVNPLSPVLVLSRVQAIGKCNPPPLLNVKKQTLGGFQICNDMHIM